MLSHCISVNDHNQLRLSTNVFSFSRNKLIHFRVNRTLNDIGSLLNENTTVFSNTTQLINDVRNLRMFAQDVASTNTTVCKYAQCLTILS